MTPSHSSSFEYRIGHLRCLEVMALDRGENPTKIKFNHGIMDWSWMAGLSMLRSRRMVWVSPVFLNWLRLRMRSSLGGIFCLYSIGPAIVFNSYWDAVGPRKVKLSTWPEFPSVRAFLRYSWNPRKSFVLKMFISTWSQIRNYIFTSAVIDKNLKTLCAPTFSRYSIMLICFKFCR